MVTVLLLLFCVGFGLVSAQIDIEPIVEDDGSTGSQQFTDVSCDISNLGECFYPKNSILGWLVITLLTYALLVLSRKGPVFVLIIVLLAGYAITNQDFTTPTTMYNEMLCEDIHYALNVGYCLLPGKPVVGWLIVISIGLALCNFIAANLQKGNKSHRRNG